MAQLKDIYEVNGNIVRNNFYTLEGKGKEFYIDPLTERYDEELKPLEHPVITPIGFLGGTHLFYICPFCQEIHIESTTNLNVDNKVLTIPCEQHTGVKIQMNMLKADKPDYIGFESDWEFMQRFEGMKKDLS